MFYPLFYSCEEFEINGSFKGVMLSKCISICRIRAFQFFMKVLRAAPAFSFSKSSSVVLKNRTEVLVCYASLTLAFL